MGRAGSRRRAVLDVFPTAQRDLIESSITTTFHIDSTRTFCAECLVAVERRIQRGQLVYDGTQTFFVDPRIAPYPILPTPMRLGAVTEFTGRGVTIAFIDSGFAPHADFLLPTERIDAIYDAARGKSRSTSPPRGEPALSAWHGTMTSASACGSGHCSGGLYRGLASDARVVLVSTMTQYGGIHATQIVRALRWVTSVHERFGIRIVSVSVGADEIALSLDHTVIELVEELVAKGIVVVAAAGNGPDVPLMPPASAPSAITVGGYDDQNSTDPRRWSLWFGSAGTTPDGRRKPDLLAPSSLVAAPILECTSVKREAEALFALAAASDREVMQLLPQLGPETSVDLLLRSARSPRLVRSIVYRRMHDEKLITSSYKHVDGTSFAAPLVSSIIAQMLEARPTLTPADVREILVATSARLPGVPLARQGAGVVQAHAAVDAARKHIDRRPVIVIKEPPVPQERLGEL